MSLEHAGRRNGYRLDGIMEELLFGLRLKRMRQILTEENYAESEQHLPKQEAIKFLNIFYHIKSVHPEHIMQKEKQMRARP